MKNKKSNSRVYFLFAAVMLCCLISGYFVGRLIGKKGDVLTQLNWDKFAAFTAASLPIAYVLFIVLLFAGCLCMYRRVRTKALHWDGEDDAEIHDIENTLNYLSIIPAVTLILSVMIFSVCVWAFIRIDNVKSPLSVVSEITFLLSFVFFMAIFKPTVDLEKKLNPEKRGNLFDFRFIKQWEASSDEGEILVEAKAGRKAFYVGQIACMAGWIVGFMGMIALHTGILAVICSCGIMLAMYLTYGIEIVRMNK